MHARVPITGPDRQITINDLPVGRSVDETIRLVKAFQFTVSYFQWNSVLGIIRITCMQDEHGEVCPLGWTEGSKTIKPDPQGAREYFSTLAEPDANGHGNDGSMNGNAKKRARVD